MLAIETAKCCRPELKKAGSMVLSVCVREVLWLRKFAGLLNMVHGEVVDKLFTI